MPWHSTTTWHGLLFTPPSNSHHILRAPPKSVHTLDTLLVQTHDLQFAESFAPSRRSPVETCTPPASCTSSAPNPGRQPLSREAFPPLYRYQLSRNPLTAVNMDTNMEDVKISEPMQLSSIPSSEPASIPTLDGWIESLMSCKQLAENDVQRLCEKVCCAVRLHQRHTKTNSLNEFGLTGIACLGSRSSTRGVERAASGE